MEEETADKAKLVMGGALAGLLLFLCPPLGVAVTLAVGAMGQKTGVKWKAKELAENLENDDDELIDTVVSCRPDKVGARVTHTFRIPNNAILPIFNTGIVETDFDLKTGKKKKRYDATF